MMRKTALWVLIPVKDFVNAKQRLSGVLSPSERRALSQAMVEDMLQCLAGVAGIAGVALVSDDSGAELLAYRYGARVIVEKGHSRGLNAAVAQAAALMPELGATHMLVLHGDLPVIVAQDIEHLIANLPAPGEALVRLVPDALRQGSNALLCSLPPPIPFCYGENSFNRHLGACLERGVACSEVPLVSLQLDIDMPQDLRQLLDKADITPQVCGKTGAVLAEYAVAKRLRQMVLDEVVTESPVGTGVDHAN
jgi:2-phospho-L-lactate guanylyltransferase